MEEAGRVLRRLRGRVERAVVGEHVDPQRADPPVAVGGDLPAHQVVAREAGRREVLGPVLHPLHRVAGDDRGDDRADVAGVDRHLVAEAAADVGRDHLDLVLGQAGDDRVERAVRVRRLRRAPQPQLAGDGVVVGDRAARLQRRRVHALERDLLGDDDHVGVVEDAVGLGLVARLPVEDVVGGLALLVVADHRRVGVERAVRVVHDRQRLVLDVDQLERVARGVVVVGDDERHLLALEADLVGRQHGLRVGRQRRHPREALRLEVLAGDDRAHLRVLERGGGVDRDDPRVRERAAQRGAVQHAGQHRRRRRSCPGRGRSAGPPCASSGRSRSAVPRRWPSDGHLLAGARRPSGPRR